MATEMLFRQPSYSAEAQNEQFDHCRAQKIEGTRAVLQFLRRERHHIAKAAKRTDDDQYQ